MAYGVSMHALSVSYSRTVSCGKKMTGGSALVMVGHWLALVLHSSWLILTGEQFTWRVHLGGGGGGGGGGGEEGRGERGGRGGERGGGGGEEEEGRGRRRRGGRGGKGEEGGREGGGKDTYENYHSPSLPTCPSLV